MELPVAFSALPDDVMLQIFMRLSLEDAKSVAAVADLSTSSPNDMWTL
jgi:hypothetical protein